MLDLEQVNFAKSNGLVTVVAQDARTGAVLMVAFSDREALGRTIETGEMHYRSRSRGLWHKGATSGNVQRVVSLSLDCDGDAILARVRPAGPACHTGTVSCFGAAALAADALGELDATIGRRARLAFSGAVPGSAAFADSLVSDGAASQLAASGRGGPPQQHDGPPATGEHHPTAASAAFPTPSTPIDPAPAPPAPPLPPPGPSYTARLLADRNLRLKKLGEEAAELVLACADDDAARAAEEGADIIYHTLVALRAVGVTLDDVRGVLAARATPPTR